MKASKPTLGYGILALVVCVLILGAVFVLARPQRPSEGVVRGPSLERKNCDGTPYETKTFDGSAAGDILYRFVYDATFRKDPAKAWLLATPHERNGMTQKEWATGTIPVVPEPVSPACTVGAKRYPTGEWMAILRINGTFYMGVVWPIHGRWLVDYFLPYRAQGAPQG